MEIKLSGDKVFHTIQGEGKSIGQPATFVRLHECNLQCSWCDTPYTWDKSMEEYHTEASYVSMEELELMIHKSQKEKQVESKCRRIVVTGGEPLLQQKQRKRL